MRISRGALLLVASPFVLLFACNQPSALTEEVGGHNADGSGRGPQAPEIKACLKPFLEPSDSSLARATRKVIEFFDDAPATALVHITISLPHVDFSISVRDRDDEAARQAKIEEKKELLKPYQEPIIELLEQHGGQAYEPGWLTNTVPGRLPAGQLLETFCWPQVNSVSVNSNYWDVVEPPWETESLGTDECPVEDGLCPAHCIPIEGAPLDDETGCTAETRVVACSRGRDEGHDAEDCRFNERLNELFYFRSTHSLAAPYFQDWRQCTSAEELRAGRAARCDGDQVQADDDSGGDDQADDDSGDDDQADDDSGDDDQADDDSGDDQADE